jgi:ligand-binding sensor protein
MKLVDIMPVEIWVEIEKEINKRSGFNAAVYDAQGMRITDFKKWANRLCPSIRETEKGLQSICSVAHQNVAAQVLKTRETVIDECDAGLMKFAVPIFVDDEFLGVAGGCGKLRGEGQVDAYLVHRIADLDEKIVGDLSGDIETIGEERLESVIHYVEKKVDEVIEEFRLVTADGVYQ